MPLVLMGKSVQKRRFWEHFVTELVVPVSAGEVFERDKLQHILPASASCAGSMCGKSVSLNICRIRKSNHTGVSGVFAELPMNLC